MSEQRIVTLVGSSRFKSKFHEVGERLEKQGITVLMMACFQHADRIAMTPEEFALVHSTDLVRIDLATEVLVINPRVWVCSKCKKPCGHCPGYEAATSCCRSQTGERVAYIGESTRREIEYATRTGKPVRYLEEPT